MRIIIRTEKTLKILTSVLMLCLFVLCLSAEASYKQIAKKTVAISVIDDNIEPRYGSGVFISKDGKIITAAHVVTMSAVITVRDINGTNYPAMIIAIDEGIDLAALSITDSGNHPIQVDSFARLAKTRVRINDKLEIVGNPYRLPFSYDRFRVSKVRPYILNPTKWIIYNAIQVNKSLSPGFSGAGAFNENGELVGIASLTALKGNITFLSPASEIKKFLKNNSIMEEVR